MRGGQKLAEYLKRECTCSSKGGQERSGAKKEGTEAANTVSMHSVLHWYAIQPEEGPVEIKKSTEQYVCKANVC